MLARLERSLYFREPSIHGLVFITEAEYPRGSLHDSFYFDYLFIESLAAKKGIINLERNGLVPGSQDEIEGAKKRVYFVEVFDFKADGIEAQDRVCLVEIRV